MRILLIDTDQDLTPLVTIRYTSGVSLYTVIRNPQWPCYCPKSAVNLFQVMFPWKKIEGIPMRLVDQHRHSFAIYEWIESLFEFKERIVY